jgi:integrase
LTRALAGHDDQGAANAIRLLLLTGCRKSEALSATWDQFDLDGRGVWVKPAHSTKQRRTHETPLSESALALLRSMRRAAPADAVHLFPGRDGRPHLADIRESWERICKAAKLADLHIHDLRHSYASQLASAGVGLHVIGALLGHTQASTTHRYAHLLDTPLRMATNRAGAVMAGLVGAKPAARGKRKLKAIAGGRS